jgi:hypothetical protein|eukprot:COSAG01_NODE_5858_length_3987_cov_188.262346_2_plen_64_part_00
MRVVIRCGGVDRPQVAQAQRVLLRATARVLDYARHRLDRAKLGRLFYAWGLLIYGASGTGADG